MEERIIYKTMEEVLHESMIPYSETVILDRALPKVEDGLKPVQRRILFAMNELGTTPDKPYKKCARVVGDCLGKYHPHGDSSIYQALVRMAQNFNMSCTLVDGQGNFGDIDGNGAAAMRYTECRLTPLSMELMKGMGEPCDEIVKWNCNFDDTLKEPDVLPGKFPNLLVNGAYGIAIGFATNIPTHNLHETIDGAVAYIDKEATTVEGLMKYVKGPDFPTGGIIIAGDELAKAYETGKGKIIIRAKLHYETMAGDKKLIVVDELPYQVNRSTLLQSIVAVRDEKKGQLLGIADVLDESDRNGMRIVIKIKKDYDPKVIADLLFKYTNLQVSFAINMVAIADGKPQTLSLLDIYRYYVDYQRDFIYKRSKCELDKAKKREHIVEGLVVAVNNIDAVVKIIKNSHSTSEAKDGLKAKFSLSDRQAEAILDLRLARLTHLEVNKLEEELKQLRETIKRLSAIIGSKKLQLAVVKSELLEIKKKFKAPRRSEILYSVESYSVKDGEDEIKIEDGVILLTQKQGLKRMTQKNFDRANKSAGESFTLNELHSHVCKTQDGDVVYLFTSQGNCFKVDAKAVEESRWREKGNSLKDLGVELAKNEKVVSAHSFAEELPKGNLIFFTKDGLVKKTAISEYGVSKSSFGAIKLKEGDELIGVEVEKKDHTMMFITQMGMCLNADMSDVPLQLRNSGGVKGIQLNDKDKCVFAKQIPDYGEIVIVTEKGFAKRVIIAQIDVMARYRKGLKIIDLKGTNGKNIKFASYVAEPYDIAFECENGAFIINSEDVSIESRTHAGKLIKKGMGEVLGVYEYINQING